MLYHWILYSQTKAYILSWQLLFGICIRVHPCILPHEYIVVESSLSPAALGEEDINSSDYTVLLLTLMNRLGDPLYQEERHGLLSCFFILTTRKSW